MTLRTNQGNVKAELGAVEKTLAALVVGVGGFLAVQVWTLRDQVSELRGTMVEIRALIHGGSGGGGVPDHVSR